MSYEAMEIGDENAVQEVDQLRGFLDQIQSSVTYNLTFSKCPAFTEERKGEEISRKAGYIVTASQRGLFGRKIDPMVMQAALQTALQAAGVDHPEVYRTNKGVLVTKGTLEALFLKANDPKHSDISEFHAYEEIHQAGQAFAEALSVEFAKQQETART